MTEPTTPTNRTADGATIVEGMPVWDNNLDLVLVGTPDRYDEGWYNTLTPAGDNAGMANGERMAARHPFTGRTAADAHAELTATTALVDSAGELIDATEAELDRIEATYLPSTLALARAANAAREAQAAELTRLAALAATTHADALLAQRNYEAALAASHPTATPRTPLHRALDEARQAAYRAAENDDLDAYDTAVDLAAALGITLRNARMEGGRYWHTATTGLTTITTAGAGPIVVEDLDPYLELPNGARRPLGQTVAAYDPAEMTGDALLAIYGARAILNGTATPRT